MTYDLPIMITEIICDTCGHKAEIDWNYGDYIYKSLPEIQHDNTCKNSACQGQFIITGIWEEIPKSEEELKYDELVEKWR